MHDSGLGEQLPARFLDLVGELAKPDGRPHAAARIAALLGGTDLLLFAADPELNIPLPAPGLPQLLRGAGEWRAFLQECTATGHCTGILAAVDGQELEAAGCGMSDGTAAVLLGSSDHTVVCRLLLPLLPLLGQLFRAERQVAADTVRLESAGEAVERARLLADALTGVRDRLQNALDEAHDARLEARRRADEAELMAQEMEAQAEELQEQANELELMNEELQQQREEAVRARCEADRANRAKSQFLANMSHELRTPINAVIGYAQLLAMGISGEMTEAQTSQLERIQSSSRHLLTLVNDVLDLAKVESGEMEVEHTPVRLRAVVLEALSMVEVDAATQDIRISNLCTDADTVFVGDQDRVRQILVNLLSNAVKFTDTGGSVTIRSEDREVADGDAHVSGEGPWLCVEVEDTGIGIDEDEQARVFQPFVQADAGHTRQRGGTGLGLTISRQLARLMGGDLTMRSEKGLGTCFRLWLPQASGRSGELDPSIRVGAASPAEP